MSRAKGLFLVAVFSYIFSPGHPLLPFRGIPIGPWGVAAGSAAVLAAMIWGAAPVRVEKWGRLLMVFLGVVLLKAGIGFVSPQIGWLARYYANESFQPPHEVSVDFPALEGTRIDPSIFFRNDTFPVHFFNDVQRYQRGSARQFTEPFSVRWMGYVQVEAPMSRSVTLAARGHAYVKLDGVSVLSLDSRHDIGVATATLNLSEGSHAAEIGYRKPPDSEGHVELRWRVDGRPVLWGAPSVTPLPSLLWELRASNVLYYVVVGLHLFAAGLFLWFIVVLITAHASPWRVGLRGRNAIEAPDWLLYVFVFLIFSVQGFWRSRSLIGRTWTLSGGDDWLAYEGGAREVLTRGLLMTFGAPLGNGEPYVYYPLYSYFLALVHKVIGEDLSGVIVSQFLILVVVNVLVHKIAREIFGAQIALLSLLAVILIEQLDFVRWYTVTLLSENLYFLTVAVSVYLLVLFSRSRSAFHLILAGAWGGISALTRPSMLLYLFPAVIHVIWVMVGQERRMWPLVRRPATYVASWFAVVSLATIRNYVVSGKPVLITSGQAATFVQYNLPSSPDADRYMRALSGSLYSSFTTLLTILIDHPGDFLNGVFVKIMFSLGMIHWMGHRPHPELVAASAGYFLALVFCPVARSISAWPIHFFIWSHLAAMTLTMPSNYGYRMILPIYLFIPIFASAFALWLWSKGIEWMSTRKGRTGQATKRSDR